MLVINGDNTLATIRGGNRLFVLRIVSRKARRARVEMRVYLVRPGSLLNGLLLPRLRIRRAVGWARFWLERWDDSEDYHGLLLGVVLDGLFDRWAEGPLDDVMGRVTLPRGLRIRQV